MTNQESFVFTSDHFQHKRSSIPLNKKYILRINQIINAQTKEFVGINNFFIPEYIKARPKQLNSLNDPLERL